MDHLEMTENSEIREATIGVVTGCNCLNVREAPDINAEVMCEIVNGTELMIDVDESTFDWFCVYIAAGISGFCMKNYITIK